MKPTAPGGLQEKWIIPILREVAEALKWVHQAGIIHRDIKCGSIRFPLCSNTADVRKVPMFSLLNKEVFSSVILESPVPWRRN